MKWQLEREDEPDADGIVNTAVRFEDEESCIFHELVSASNQKEVASQNLP
jgi:hypothetical protein